jgi:hypothetical protein
MTQTTLSGVSPAAEPEQPRPGSRAARLALPRAVDALKALAVEHGVCIRPIALRRTDLTNGHTELIDLPCGATLEAKCPPCAQKARRLRQVQIREGWHRTDEPLPPPHPATEEQKALPPFLVHELRAHRFLTVPDERPDPRALVFATWNGTPLRRSNFRRQVWRPALVRAGFLGRVVEKGPDDWRAMWHDREGIEWMAELPTERDAIAHVAEHAHGGLRFHDLRHSYATWLVSDGVPVNVVQRVMGHEQASTTLNRYTHAPDDFAARVRAAFDDPMPLCCLPRRTIFPATIRQLVSPGVSWANSGGAQGT